MKNFINIDIKNLRCEFLENPLGVDVMEPRLGWKLYSSSKNVYQEAYQIMVSSSRDKCKAGEYDLWDSRKVLSEKTSSIKYKGKELKSNEIYYWKVKVWDNYGDSFFSEINTFEMGLLQEDDWKAKWISMDWKNKAGWSPIFRKDFNVKGKVKKARAYISGLGYFEMTINGCRVGDNVLDPAQTDYNIRTFYVTHDMTYLLKDNSNTVGVMLGDGFYHQNKVWGGNMAYGVPRLICQIHIEYNDGTKEIILSNNEWKCFYGPIVLNNIYSGENYDSRLEQKGWNEPNFDDSQWYEAEEVEGPAGKLVSQMIPPIKRMEYFHPKEIKEIKKGIYIVDMGRNFAGWTRLKANLTAGTEVTMRHSESVYKDGTPNFSSTGVQFIGMPQTHKYIFNGEEKVFEPKFNYCGFRYIEVTGLPFIPEESTFEGVAVYTALEESGEFQCSNEDINNIHKMVKNTITSNLQGNITDCPTREKCGWLGDAMIIADSIMYNWDAVTFWEKYTKDIESTRKANGTWMMIAPGKRVCGEAAPAWGAAQVQIPWYLYEFYNDVEIVEDQYDAIKEWTNYLLSKAEEYLISFGIGDWWYPGGRENLDVPHHLISTAYFFQSTILTAKIAKVLCRTEDIEVYNELAENIKKAFNKRYYNKEKSTYGTQTADSFALALGLVEDENELKVAETIANDIKYRGFHVTTGHIGTKYIFEMLTDYGYEDYAFNALVQKEYPGFVHLLNEGYTTIPERWEGDKDYGEPRNTGSLSHPFKGGFDSWIYSHILGIKADAPGFKKITIKPYLIGDLSWAKGSYETIYGKVKCQWNRECDNFRIKVTIPVNTSAKVYLPVEGKIYSVIDDSKEKVDLQSDKNKKKYIEIESGEYEFIGIHNS
ncbi:family 78 glycoside hydrolase catalytic domain [Clostridium grantii]|uniref:alpha-L-rhamnosidase n=1 Tax=Clostridium grantii DSM 8605 TaxID=1121316 RepID=A0A1M5SWG5_9CLOT|nr:family 78 glycoside hydrolase catalytic domain [Clostridium grantii]SHH42588.1 alpha-L-rhamnosidase [Clostridium grantii DSM 8605]